MTNLRRRLVIACLCLMTYTWPGLARAVDGTVWIALGEGGGAYAEAAEAARTELLRGASREIVAKPWRDLAGAGGPPPRLVVAVGVGAMRGIVESGIRAPMVATLVPRASYQRFADSLGGGSRNLTAVWLDQPAARQLELLRLALPQKRRIGVLLGSESRPLEAELLRAGSDRGMEIIAAHAYSGEQVSSSLQRTLEDSDVLLAVPDPQIYNGSTIQNILTAAYRRRLPLVGFSAAYVKAGALLALYSTPAQVGAQAGEVARLALTGKPLPPPQWPREFTVGVNPDVSRSLGIALEAEAGPRLAEQLRTRERQP